MLAGLRGGSLKRLQLRLTKGGIHVGHGEGS